MAADRLEALARQGAGEMLMEALNDEVEACPHRGRYQHRSKRQRFVRPHPEQAEIIVRGDSLCPTESAPTATQPPGNSQANRPRPSPATKSTPPNCREDSSRKTARALPERPIHSPSCATRASLPLSWCMGTSKQVCPCHTRDNASTQAHRTTCSFGGSRSTHRVKSNRGRFARLTACETCSSAPSPTTG